MLKIESLTVSFGKHTVLQDVSLHLAQGEVLALLGPNGCGKSTLLHTVMGENPYTGRILLGDTPLSSLSPAKRARELSLLPQHLPAPALTVRETVSLGLAPRTAKLGAAEWKKIDAQLARLDLTALADRPVSTLSGGERQRVFLALILVQDTPFVLLDEPTTYMDAPTTARFFALVQELKAAGKGVLLVLHDVGQALEHADGVAVLTNGTLAFCGSPAEALAREIPEKHFGLTRYTAQRGEKTAYFFK